MRKKIFSILFLFCFVGNQLEIQANEITIGIALGFTGPTESIVPSMASSAELAVSEANSSKIFLNGEEKVNSIKIDTKCELFYKSILIDESKFCDEKYEKIGIV